MNPKELRIGNWVYFSRQNPPIDTGYYRKRIEIQDFKHAECLHPIPITEEWLLKFGFFKYQNEHWQLGNYMYWIPNGYWGSTGVLQLAIGVAPVTNAPCQYVHQLQNIYFALTGKDK